MAKKIFNSQVLNLVKRNLQNSLGDDAKEFKTKLDDLFAMLDAAEETADLTSTLEEVKKLIAEAEETMKEANAETIANAIAKAKAEILANSMAGKKGVSAEIKNKVAKAIVMANSREEVRANVNRVLTENGISGLLFEDVIDYAIVDNWGDYNELFGKLRKTEFTKFLYNTDELQSQKNILAKQWNTGVSEGEKLVQQLALTPKTLVPDYIYKIQDMAMADIARTERNGKWASLEKFITEELMRQWVNTVILHIILGDTINDAGTRISTFESIGAKTVTDAFTFVSTAAAAITNVDEVRALCDKVQDQYGEGKVLVMSQSEFTALSKFKYANGGDSVYRSKEEMAGQFGVSEIYIANFLEGNTTIHAVCFVPAQYWWVEDGEALNVAYPTYKENKRSWQFERCVAGGVHGLLSSAVLKRADED